MQTYSVSYGVSKFVKSSEKPLSIIQTTVVELFTIMGKILVPLYFLLYNKGPTN